MRTFESMKSFIEDLPGVPEGIIITPGPDVPEVPDRFVCLTRYGGPGLILEGAMDGIAWQIRLAGTQNNYSDAESIADAIDVGLLSVTTANIGGVHVAGVQRVGGAPNPLLKDDSDRTQFICSYIIDTSMALAN